MVCGLWMKGTYNSDFALLNFRGLKIAVMVSVNIADGFKDNF